MRPASLLVRTSALCATLALALPLGASAACTPPVPPDQAAKPAKPVPPLRSPCVDAKLGTPGCLGWEGARFNEEVRAYNDKLPAFQAAAKDYVTKLNAYVQAGGAFAQCEVETLR